MEVSTIILDNGSNSIRAGVSGDPAPLFDVPTVLCTRSEDDKIEYFIGEDALQQTEGLFSRPIRTRSIKNYNDVEIIWNDIVREKLRLNPEEHPFLLTESSLCTKAEREKNIEIIMEKFKAPAYYSTLPEILSLYAAGLTTGLVIDAGDEDTHILPVFECYAMTHVQSTLEIGGKHINDFLKKLLAQNGGKIPKNIETKVLRDIKENYCYIAYDIDEELQKADHLNDIEKSYFLPEGQELILSTQRFKCVEPLFDPQLLQIQSNGLPYLVNETIQKCGELKNKMYHNILLSGGTSMFPGFKERLHKDLSQLVPSETTINIISPEKRNISSWIGASVLSSLATFSQMWVSKAEYEETGSSIVHWKCF